MRRAFLATCLTAILFCFGVLSVGASVTAPATDPLKSNPTVRSLEPFSSSPTLSLTLEPLYELPEVFEHGDCSWIPPVALAAGWKPRQIPKLLEIIARESGCCPRRIGGSQVDANCQFVKMWDMTHPSDSGLLQLNGVHWKPDHPQYAGLLCKKAGICTQEPLLDAFTNLKMGRMLFDVAGWSPWNPIN